MADKLYYHYTDDEGSKSIIRSGKIQASLSSEATDDAGFGNGVYLTTLKAKTCTKSDIAMNNWLKVSVDFINRTSNYFVLKIPDSDIKDASTDRRNIFLFGNRKDLCLHKYKWWLVNYDSDTIISSYKYQMSSFGPSTVMPGLKSKLGEYKMSDETVNGRPVYKHETSDLYLFMTKLGSWMVGSDPGQDIRSFLQVSKNSLGPDSKLPWDYWSDGQWHEDDITLRAYAWQV